MKSVPVLKQWLPLAAGLTVAFATMYIAGQQLYRQAAYDPQVQQARDAQTATIDGRVVDISTSLAVIQMNFDASMHVTATTGQLHGRTVKPPNGVFEYAKSHGENRLTWQPENGVRMATVVVKKSDGYVLVARNLSEVERRTDALMAMVAFGWLASLGVSLSIQIWHGRDK